MLDRLAAFADKYEMFPSEGIILAAVSGGADSVCLLSALLELADNRGFSVAAVHYNHKLRGAESDRDAQFTENLCREKEVTLFSGSGNVAEFAQQHHLGIEEAARRMRYDFFYETAQIIAADRIATAHTADDNAETILLNMARGTGLKGLGGIPPKRGLLIRPMLTLTRNDVIDFLSQRSITFVEDSSNKLDIYSRNMIRHRVIPVLKDLNPRLTEHLTSMSALIREDDAYLNGIAEKYIHDNCRSDTRGSAVKLDALEIAGLPRPISSRVIRLIFGNNLSAGHISDILELCANNSTSGEIMLPSGTAYREYDRIAFSHTPCPTSFAPVKIIGDGVTDIPELRLTVKCFHTGQTDTGSPAPVSGEKINKSFTTFLFKYDNICGKIVIRPRLTGDKIDLFGRNGTKTLKKLFIERQIPLKKRSLVPVIADDKGVLAVYGIGIDARAACEAGDQILEIIFEETAYEK